MNRLLICGVSTRAAAESAARAGFVVTAIDAFADLDQHPGVRAISVPRDLGRRFTARAAARAARAIECDAVAYLSNLENHPSVVAMLARGRTLWGNPPDVLRRVRDPGQVAVALRRHGLAVPMLRSNVDAAHGSHRELAAARETAVEWLMKPLASGGGHRVGLWRDRQQARRIPRGFYLQELIAGTAGSVVFVAAGGGARILGVSRQLVGEEAFGASGYRYCGSLLTIGQDERLHARGVVTAAGTLASVIAGEFGLVGANGIDFVARDGVPYVVEINPRWSASMELVERACGLSIFGAHAAACRTGALPDVPISHPTTPGVIGKAIVFARHDVTTGDTRPWLADRSVRDVPHPGERIATGSPVCTIFAEANDESTCHAALVERAERVYAELVRWAPIGAL